MLANMDRAYFMLANMKYAGMAHIQMFQSLLIEVYMVSRFATPDSWQKYGFAGYGPCSECVGPFRCVSSVHHVCKHD